VISLSLFTPDSTSSISTASRRCAARRGTCSVGSVGGTIRYITNRPVLNRSEGSVEGNLNLVDGKDIGGHLKGAINLPLGANAALRVVGYHTEYGGFIDALA
jgi:iron complex outermembrane receptor protein